MTSSIYLEKHLRPAQPAGLIISERLGRWQEMTRPLLILLFAILDTAPLCAQNADLLTLRDSLRLWSGQLKTERDPSRVHDISLKMEKALTAAYNGKSSLGPELDSLPHVGQVSPVNQAFRLVNWNTIDTTGRITYHAVVVHPGPQKLWVTTVLRDSTDLADGLDTRKIGPDQWYGALYYKAIVSTWKKKTLYTLLGWDGHDQLTNRKLIDLIGFEKGRPVFGAPVFKADKKTRYRLIYEYGEEATMLLRYDDKLGMIVMDHLAPKEPYLKGNYQYYGPDMSHDALDFVDGKWVLITDIDARNRKERGKKYNQP